jgi:hypothetical protein
MSAPSGAGVDRRLAHMCHAHGTGKTRRLLSRTIDMPLSAAHWEILEIYDSLISALSGSCCIVELLGHCDRLDQVPTGWETSARCRKTMHAAYSACFEWLMRPRSIQEWKALQLYARECTCQSSKEHKNLHAVIARRLGQHRPAPTFSLIVILMLRPVENYWKDPFEASLRRLVAPGRKSRWPSRLKDVLPHGADHTVRSIINLFALRMNAGVRLYLYLAFQLVVSFAHTLVVPHMIHSPTLVDRVINVPFMDDKRLLTSLIPDDTAVACSAEVSKCLEAFQRFMYTFLHRLHTVERCEFHRQTPSLLAQSYNQAMLNCSQLHVLSGLKNNPITPDIIRKLSKTFATFGGLLYDDSKQARLVEIEPENRKLFFKRAMVLTNGLERTAWYRLVPLLVYFKISNHCFAIGCTRTIADGARLKRCAGCLRVQYCSRECQKAAWTHEVAPHRVVCGTVAQVYAEVDIPDGSVATVYKEIVPPNNARLYSGFDSLAFKMLYHFNTLAIWRVARSRQSPSHVFVWQLIVALGREFRSGKRRSATNEGEQDQLTVPAVKPEQKTAQTKT